MPKIDLFDTTNAAKWHTLLYINMLAEILFKNIAIPEYIALEEIKDSLENGKVFAYPFFIGSGSDIMNGLKLIIL